MKLPQKTMVFEEQPDYYHNHPYYVCFTARTKQEMGTIGYALSTKHYYYASAGEGIYGAMMLTEIASFLNSLNSTKGGA